MDQDVAELTYLTPLFTAADGVRTAAVSDGITMGVPPLAGTRSGYLNGTSDSRLSRTATLSATSSYWLSWKDEATLSAGLLRGAAAAPYAPFYQVVLRDPASGALLGDPLFVATSDVSGIDRFAVHEVPLPAGMSGPVQISFELRSAASGFAVVDDVVLSDAVGPVDGFLDGDFEATADLGPWSANAGAEIQNIRSGARAMAVVAGTAPVLTVTRTFYAPPAASWARMVDVFENASAAPVSTSAVYVTTLGGTLYAIRADGKVVVGWDKDGFTRDVAVVVGSGTTLVDPLSGMVFAVHPLEVPAGGKVALVHFVVQLGQTEGGPTSADVPAGVDAEAQAIVAGFPAQAAYAVDFEPGVLNLVRNF